MKTTRWKAATIAAVALATSGTASLAAYVRRQALRPQTIRQQAMMPRPAAGQEGPCAALVVSPPKYVPSTYPSMPLYNPLWLSPTQLINPNSNSRLVSVIDTTTGLETPLDDVKAAIQEREKAFGGHTEMPFDPSFLRLSPDGRWLLWPSGTTEHPTWEAITVEGAERREWDRDSGSPIYKGIGGVAWMRDSTHWVEVGERIARGQKQDYVRVYSMDTPEVNEFPLRETPTPDAAPPAFPQFIFTTDGRAWMVRNSGGARAGAAISIVDYFELLPGPDVWALRHTPLVMQARAFEAGRPQAQSDEFALSPDGHWLVRRDNSDYPERRTRIILSRPDGSAARTLFETTHLPAFLHWTPDGQKIVFHWDGGGGIANAPNGEGMYAISLDHLADCLRPSLGGLNRVGAAGPFPVMAGQVWPARTAQAGGR